ncbi:uncharacterized protein LOC119730865 isoform X5 [Patiria miniata]|uniref:Fucolectin tachylectin-4 pentraxin-1 domain-containing protein n=1 Tax=Patiria miniata TaxID=46514 RepID=A0A914A7T0_PATMI|nr:uncharacterized protein LOC119730865 isoform X5 [Patiria miniata]
MRLFHWVAAAILVLGLAGFQIADALNGEEELQFLVDRALMEITEDKKSEVSQAFSIVGKPALQSTSHSSGKFPASNAVDGSLSSDVAYCSHTVGDSSNPWWRVDLGEDHCISKVRILNRGDCCSERLEGAVVRAGDNPHVTINPTCGSPVTAAQAQPRGGIIEFACSPALRARYVSVNIHGTGTLQLCEVTVEEFSFDQCVVSQAFSIVGKPALQSTSHSSGKFPASNAVDGSLSSDVAYCSHTVGDSSNPWWRVDLGEDHCISKVRILNRGDCCSERLEGAVVRAGDNPHVTINPTCGSPVTAAQAQPRGGIIEFDCSPALRARYVSVNIHGTGTLQLCEVTVEEFPFDQCEVSQAFSIVGKPALQSTSHSSGKFPASNAVDGSLSSDVAYCSHTVGDSSNPWWRVDLGEDHCISKVRILNRGDCCSERLEGAVVRAGDNPHVTINPTCGSPVTAAQAQPRGGIIEFDCSPALRARYVSVNIHGTGTLQLCEVTVEEFPFDQCEVSQAFSIVGKPALQCTSHSSGKFPASNAVDGSLSSDVAYCSHTVGDSSNPWWRVDLGEDHCISKVRILNRGDCCSERLEGAVVRAGDNPHVTINPTCGSPVTAAQAQPRGGIIEFDCSPALRARYVSVNIPGTGTLQLCEVTVEEFPFDQCEVSQAFSIVGKPALQSTSHSSGKFPASNAVDGSLSSDVAYCSHTVGDSSNPWWRVDLGEDHCISKVRILNRGDCCSERLEGAVVRAGDNPHVTINPTCGSPVTAAQAQPRGGIIEFDCSPALRARYVSVNIPGTGTLQLCEVTVEEFPFDQCEVSQAFSIVGKPALQSTSHSSGKFPASNAVDGSLSSNVAYCSHTVGDSSNPWWRVDLGADHCISKVRILNRGDCCSERLEGAVVRAGDSPHVTINPTCGSPVTAAQAQPRGGIIEFDCSPALRARYVSVNIHGTGTLQLCEVTVEEFPFDQCEVSQVFSIVGKPALQSTSHSSGKFPASNAVDGSLSSDVAYCSHTVGDSSNPWWRVDLGEDHCISKVRILNRGDCCSERLEGAVVRAGDNPHVTINPTCGSPVTAVQAQPRGGIIEFDCSPALRARYVSVNIHGTGTLQLCEVTVEEFPFDQCVVSQAFSIVGKPALQSTSHSSGKFPASNAVDGSLSSDVAYCSHTVGASSNPWWRVDLGEDHCISKVRILNRGDCCSERLEGAVVRAGDSPHVTINPTCGSPVTAAQAQPRGGTIEFDCSPALRARYVSVNVQGTGTLQLCEVTVEEFPFDKCVVSQAFSIVGKPAVQSTSHCSGNFPATNAVDGSLSSDVAYCSHTVGGSSNPWWRVDLGEDHCISKVRILNRGDCCSERLEGAIVRAGDSSYVTINPTCGSPVTAAQAQPRGDIIEFDCSPALRARYVSVNIPGTGTLQLCEVTVEEFPFDQCEVSQVFSIVGKPALQSTSHSSGKFPASNAVDGSLSSNVAYCSHTVADTRNPWWRVDLEEEQCVTKVTILNRGDCCSERLFHAQVRAGLSGTVTQNPACGAPVTISQAQPLGGIVEIDCDRPLRARYVSVDIPGTATLQLCEVYVDVLSSGGC